MAAQQQQQKQSQPGNVTKKTIRIPLVGNNQQRGTDLNKDQRFVNCFPETTKNLVTSLKKLFLVKRPGTVVYSSPSTTSEGRGAWILNGSIYSVFGSTLYKDTTSIGTLTTATGLCGATTFLDATNFNRETLFIADGTDAWVVYDTTVTKVDNNYLQWYANTIIEVGDRVIPTGTYNKWFVCTVAGQTGTTEPTWDNTVGNTTTDGTVTWRCEGNYTGYARWNASAANYVTGDIIRPTSGNDNGLLYKVIVGGNQTTEPTWPTELGQTVAQDGITYECWSSFGGFPTPHITTPVFLDGYVFLPETNSVDIYNSDLLRTFGWDALNFASAENFPDGVSALARQNNYIVAFGSNSIEFFYDNLKQIEASGATPTVEFTSPLARHDSLVVQTGLLTKNCVLSSEKFLMFLGKSNLGGRSVWLFDGTKPSEVSTEYIEKFLDNESDVDAITGFSCRIAGHVFFVINLPDANTSFVYDLEEQMWHEWQYNGTEMPFISAIDNGGTIYLQHATDGKIYRFGTDLTTDSSYDIIVKIVTAKQDYETDKRKFYHRLTIIGDALEGQIQVRWSDDDYSTWSNYKYLTAGTRPYFLRLGASRRRAWELKYEHASALRLEFLELVYSTGTQ